MKKYILFLFFGFYYTLFFADKNAKTFEIENADNYFIGVLAPMIDTSISKINVYFFNNEHDSILHNVIMYDRLGRKCSIMTLDKIGKTITQKTDLSYLNNTNILLNTTINKFYDKKIWTDICAYEYDPNGKILAQYFFDIDTSFLITYRYKYDDNKLTKVLIKESGTQGFYKNETRKYDKLNRIVKIDEFFSDKSLFYTLKFTYDENIISEYYVSSSEPLNKQLQNVKEYSNGNLIRYKKISQNQQQTLKGTNGNVLIKSDNFEANYFYEGKRLSYMNIKYSDNSIKKIRIYYVQKLR